MKQVTAIIKHFKLDDVIEALTKLGVQGITVYDVKGYGQEKGHTELYEGKELIMELLPKAKLELILPEDLVDQAIDVIRRIARTGKAGDGIISVSPVETALHIRTGEHL